MGKKVIHSSNKYLLSVYVKLGTARSKCQELCPGPVLTRNMVATLMPLITFCPMSVDLGIFLSVYVVMCTRVCVCVFVYVCTYVRMRAGDGPRGWAISVYGVTA